MTSTDPSPKTSGSATGPTTAAGHRGDERAEMTRAAADLEALADAYDDCTESLETMEATVDTLLDDGSSQVLVLDADRRVTAVSRGMAELLGGGEQLLGRRAASVVPPAWSGLHSALDSLTDDDGWRHHGVGDGGDRLALRRATSEDRSPVYVVRFEGSGD